MAATRLVKRLGSPSAGITQVWRDEHPDNYVLSSKERRMFRNSYPLPSTPLLPPKKPNDTRATLVLDLDETLIHSRYEIPDMPAPNTAADAAKEILTEHKINVVSRPHVKTFLSVINPWYEIVVFTASLSFYADGILNDLDPKGTIFDYRLYRAHCCYFQGIYVKDLERLGRSLNRVILVDNFPGAYMMQPRNALPIHSFLGNPDDNELLRVQKVLKLIKDKPDVRPFLKRYRKHWTASLNASRAKDDCGEHVSRP